LTPRASAGARAQNIARARSERERGSAGPADATHREIAVVRLLAGCWKFKVGRRKFTDVCAAPRSRDRRREAAATAIRPEVEALILDYSDVALIVRPVLVCLAAGECPPLVCTEARAPESGIQSGLRRRSLTRKPPTDV
jgi:hypothetical protein